MHLKKKLVLDALLQPLCRSCGKDVNTFQKVVMTFKKLFTTFVRQRGALSGVKEKFSGIIDQNLIRIAESSERSTYHKACG